MHYPSLLRVYLFIVLHITLSNASCPNHCSDHGVCQGTSCTCFAGYFEKDCSKSITEGYSQQLIGIQISLGIIFFSIALLCGTALYHAIVRKFSSLAVVNNIQFIVFGSYLIVSITHTIYTSIDPLRVWGIMNLMATSLLLCTFFPFSIFAFISVLFHWIDLINISVTTLRKEEMLQKISIHYKPKDITLEDMVEKLKFLGKLKIPFVFLIILEFVAIYTTQIIGGAGIQPFMMVNFLFIIVFLYYGVLSIGFLIYSKRLISIMPFELTKKVRRLTSRVTLLCIFVLVAVVVLGLVFILVPRDHPAGYLALWTIIQLTIAFVCLSNVSVFLNWKKRFPFVAFSGAQTSTKSTSRHGASVEVEELDTPQDSSTM